MSNRLHITGLLLIVISLALIAIGINNYHPSVEEVEVTKGQVWVYESEDPFDPFINEYEVLEAKGGYVKYRDTKTGGVHSSSIYIYV